MNRMGSRCGGRCAAGASRALPRVLQLDFKSVEQACSKLKAHLRIITERTIGLSDNIRFSTTYLTDRNAHRPLLRGLTTILTGLV